MVRKSTTKFLETVTSNDFIIHDHCDVPFIALVARGKSTAARVKSLSFS